MAARLVMTVQDEARDLLRQQRAAEDELQAVRREIDEVVADRGGHIDVEAAETFRRRLEAAQDKLASVKRALVALNEDAGPPLLSRFLCGSVDEPAHWCPGCNMIHVLPWKRGGWAFNGDVESPTFIPSFKHRWHEGTVEKICHYILTGGVLDFCSDSTHGLRGKVPLPPLPAPYGT